MKLTLSRIWACILSILYNGDIYYHHINSNGYWEFEIGHRFFDAPDITYYKTKGLK